jgi:catechol-2,3-dioxygenase
MGAESDIVNQLGYIAIGVANLDDAVEYYSNIARLELTERIGNTAFMTGGTDHHWIRLEEGNGRGVKRVAYELVDESGFDELRTRLKDRNIDVAEGGDPASERVNRWMRFTDPGGMEIEVFTEMWERGVAPVNAGVTIEKFLHGGWETKNYAETQRFYFDVMGFRASDYIADKVTFMRAGDRYHHSTVILNSNRTAFNHFCVQVESLDDVMRFRNNALRRNVALRDDLLRHAPSGSIGVYVMDEAHGLSVEYCVGHPQLDDTVHKPRVLPMAPETGDVWRSPLPDIAPRTVAEGATFDSWADIPQVGTAADQATVD